MEGVRLDETVAKAAWCCAGGVCCSTLPSMIVEANDVQIPGGPKTLAAALTAYSRAVSDLNVRAQSAHLSDGTKFCIRCRKLKGV